MNIFLSKGIFNSSKMTFSVAALFALMLVNSSQVFAQEDKENETSKEELTLSETPPTIAPSPSISGGDQGLASERVIQIHHPNAAKGLIRINEDKSYQYRVKLHDKSSAASFGVSVLTSPKVSNSVNGTKITYNSMYGAGDLYGVQANYEWIPIRKLGSWGVIFETGLSMSHGNGILASSPPEASQETYTLFIVPLTAMLKYRFEYMRKQWFVPYIEGGATYYGLAELRSDSKQTNVAGSPAAGGGGGIAINISKGDSASVFNLDREYGISDLWLNIEARVMAGLKPELDFTNTTINVGVTVDY